MSAQIPVRSDVCYSCVLAEGPAYAQQVLTWIWSLLDLAHVPADRCVVHALEGASAAAVAHLQRLGVEVRPCQPFHADHPHCNKVRQLESNVFDGAETVVLCDTDIAFVGEITSYFSQTAVRAKVVDLPNPPMAVWEALLDAAGLDQAPARAATSFGGFETLAANCNGGLYVLPAAVLAPLRECWPKWCTWLIARPELVPAPYDVHIDQVAFTLAMLETGLPLEHLPLEANCPTHELVGQTANCHPAVLHYHRNVDASGFLRLTGAPGVDTAIDTVNAMIRARRRQAFDNQSFWDFRYRTAPDLGSGIGSRGAVLDVKRALLASAISRDDTVLDVGCGDLEVSRVLVVDRYTGIDVSEEALALARQKRPEWTFIHGELPRLDPPPSDVVLCLDVLIHQRTEAAYRSLIAHLLRLADRTLLVSGYNQPPWYQSEITFYHEPLTTSLARWTGHEALDIIGGYRDTTVVRVRTDVVTSDRVRRLRRTRLFDTPTGRYRVVPDDLIATQFTAFGGHTRNELAMLLSLVAPGDTIIDVGAHVGSFTIPIAQRVGPEGRVIAIEPDPFNVECLFQNVVDNRLEDRVTIVPALVSTDAGPRRGVVDPSNTGAVYFVPDATGEGPKGISIDALAARAGRSPALIKIDVEGMEPDVLASAADTLRDARPLLYFEVAAHQLARYGATTETLDAALRQHRYLTYRNTGERNSTHDQFTITPIDSVSAGGTFFDCLAVPAERVADLVAAGLLPPRAA